MGKVVWLLIWQFRYLNSGPSGIGGYFIRTDLDDGGRRCVYATSIKTAFDIGTRLAGWWGNDSSTRFQMAPTFRPTPGAKGYQHSCTPVLSSIPLLATLDLIDKAGFDNMIAKGRRLTNTMEELLKSSRFYIPSPTLSSKPPFPSAEEKDDRLGFRILTPPAPWRGTQLSLYISPHRPEDGDGKGVMPRVFGRMMKKGLVGDEREPSVIRLSPVVLYNTFAEIGRAVKILEEAMEEEEEGMRIGVDQGKGAERDVISG